MKRNILLSVFLFLGLAMAIGISASYRFFEETIVGISRQIPSRKPAAIPIPSLQQERQKAAPEKALPATEPLEINFQQQLQIEKEKLAEQKEILETLQSQQDQSGEWISFSYPAQVNANILQIQNLTDELQAQHNTEIDLGQLARDALQERTHSAQLSRDQLDPRIRSLEQDIQETRQQINMWITENSLLSVAQEAQVRNLQELLTAQLQERDSLNDQRAAISAEMLLQGRFVTGAVQQQKNSLIQSQADLQNQIFSLREEISRLHTTNSQLRMSLIPLSQRIRQAEQNYEDQQKTVQSLEALSR